MTHVEMYDSQNFCGEDDADACEVRQGDWHFMSKQMAEQCGVTEEDSLAALKKADCPECLRRLALLGHTAQRRLVEVLAPLAAAEMLNRKRD